MFKPEELFQYFINVEGRLPAGFSAPYDRRLDDCFFRGTPFDEYLDDIRNDNDVDVLHNRSGISSWLYLDDSVDINTAVTAIFYWVERHREMRKRLEDKCRIGDAAASLPLPMSIYFSGFNNIMIVIDDGCRFNYIPPESVRRCKAAGISFCTNLSYCTMYDLTERRIREITYVTYPNYHDETYADWSLQ